MNAFSSTFFEFLLNASGQAIVIVALVLLVQRIARHRISPAARHALWWLVMMRLLIPWFPQSSVSVFNLGPDQPVSSFTTKIPETFTSTPVFSNSFQDIDTPIFSSRETTQALSKEPNEFHAPPPGQ